MYKMNATELGTYYGVNGKIMNRILAHLGYLKGTPGAWELTEKGMLYAIETDVHRGCGGYSWYNRSWTIRSFDDAIVEELDNVVTDELIEQIIAEMKGDNAAKEAAAEAFSQAALAAQEIAEKFADEANCVIEEDNASDMDTFSDDLSCDNFKKAGLIGGILVSIIAICAIVYSHKKKKKPVIENASNTTEDENENNSAD